MTEKTEVLGQKPVPLSQCHLSTTNPTWTYRVMSQLLTAVRSYAF